MTRYRQSAATRRIATSVRTAAPLSPEPPTQRFQYVIRTWIEHEYMQYQSNGYYGGGYRKVRECIDEFVIAVSGATYREAVDKVTAAVPPFDPESHRKRDSVFTRKHALESMAEVTA